MKVCTDATLFGAMAPIKGGERVLDVGAGCGLLSLMVTQLGASRAVGVELTEVAYEEARHNFEQSPWDGKLAAVLGDIRGFARGCNDKFDLIISNPPFFDNHTKTGDSFRNLARHTDSLSFLDLVRVTDHLLDDDGLFYLLIPQHAVDRVTSLALDRGLYLCCQVDFASTQAHQVKVSALTYSRREAGYTQQRLNIYQSHRVYTDQSKRYLQPFLLRYAK